MLSKLPVFAAALWWGSLCAVGFLAVPLLFAHLPTPAIAGNMAARLFSAQTWVALACGLVLLLSLKRKEPDALVQKPDLAIVFVVGGMLFAALVEFGVAPRIVQRENLKLWHSVGSAMFVLQWLCAAAVLWLTAPRAPADQV